MVISEIPDMLHFSHHICFFGGKNMLTKKEREELRDKLMSAPEERKALLEQVDEPSGTLETFDITKDPYNHMNRMIFTRWKPYLLRAIYVDNGTNFSKFYKQLPISQKVLSQNLKEMVEDGLIWRDVIPEVPPRVIYRLTEKGETIILLLDLVYDWGWNDMKHRGLPVDILGEMWHGYREPDESLMNKPFSTEKYKPNN